jgi:WD40 repeat protein
LAYDPHGRYLAVGDTTGRVQLFLTDDLHPAGLAVDTGEDGVAAIAFSSDGSELAVGTLAGDVQLFDVERARSITPLLAGQGAQISGLAFSDADTTVLASSFDGTTAIYDAAGLPATGHVLSYGSRLEQAAIEIAVSPNGQLAAATHLDGAVTVWNLATGQRVGADISLTAPSTGVAFSPDGRQLVASDDAGNVTTWTTDTWQTIGPTISIPGRSLVPALGYSPDGRVLAAGQEIPPSVFLYDAESHRPIGDPIRVPRREESQPIPWRGAELQRRRINLSDRRVGHRRSQDMGRRHGRRGPDLDRLRERSHHGNVRSDGKARRRRRDEWQRGDRRCRDRTDHRRSLPRPATPNRPRAVQP